MNNQPNTLKNSTVNNSLKEHTKFKYVARVVGKIGKDGEVKVEPIDDLPFLLQRGMFVYLNPPKMVGLRSAQVVQVREVGDAFGVRFEGCSNSTQAFDLVGRFCLVACDELHDLDEEDDPSLLVGANVIDCRLGDLGQVCDVTVNSMQALLFVGTLEYPDKYMIPLVDEYVSDYDENANIIYTKITDELANLNK